ncbi:MAG: lysine biosynthesis enzyme LysX, partial [Candidatus Methanomethylicota archaeon]
MSRSLSLIYDRIRVEEKELISAAERLGVNLKLVDAKTFHFDLNSLEKEKSVFGELALERCISYFRGLHITAILENAGIPVINSFKTSSICGNKLLTTLTLIKAGVPTPKTV